MKVIVVLSGYESSVQHIPTHYSEGGETKPCKTQNCIRSTFELFLDVDFFFHSSRDKTFVRVSACISKMTLLALLSAAGTPSLLDRF
jgi:hypothetical protein